MIPLNPWEHQNAIKTLYAKCVGKVCVKHEITRLELDILLFLANNPCFDTATDIVEIRYLSKSQVSFSVRNLEECGYLRKEYLDNNKKTAHLKICERAVPIVMDGKAAQEEFAGIIMKDFSPEEMRNMQQYYKRMCDNINNYVKETVV